MSLYRRSSSRPRVDPRARREQDYISRHACRTERAAAISVPSPGAVGSGPCCVPAPRRCHEPPQRRLGRRRRGSPAPPGLVSAVPTPCPCARRPPLPPGGPTGSGPAGRVRPLRSQRGRGRAACGASCGEPGGRVWPGGQGWASLCPGWHSG